MKQRSKELIIISLIYLGISLSIPLQVMFQYQLSFADWDIVMNRLTTLNIHIFFLGIICAQFVYHASRGVLIAAPLYLVAITWNNFQFSGIDANFPAWQAGLATFFAWSFHGLLLREGPLKLLKNPEMRWWRIAERAPVQIRTHIHPATGGDFVADTFDLSESGMFLRQHTLDWRTASGNTKPQQLRIGTHCRVRLRLDNRQYVDCSAQIVRHAQANGQYPTGYGLRFLNIEKIHQKTLREFIERTQNHSENQDYGQKAA